MVGPAAAPVDFRALIEGLDMIWVAMIEPLDGAGMRGTGFSQAM